QVAAADVDAQRHRDREGEEAEQLGLEVVRAAEDGDVRAAAGAGAADDVGEAVAVHVGRGHADAAGEVHVVGEEAGQAGLGVVLAGKDGDVGPAAGVGAADDVREAVVVRVAGRQRHAAGEAHVEGEEAEQHFRVDAIGDVL